MAKPKQLLASVEAAQPPPENKQSRTAKALSALELRKAGHPWHVIAPQVGYKNANHASKEVSALLATVKRESSQEFIELQLQRLDQIASVAYLKFLASGDAKLGGLLLKTWRDQNVLMGLSADPIIAARNARARATSTGAMLPSEAYGNYTSADDLDVVDLVLEAEYRDLIADGDLEGLDELVDTED